MIEEMEEYGQIFERVRKTNIQGGMEVPIASLKPTASWIGEDTPSDRQKLTADDKVSFNYYGLECRVSIGIVASAVTLNMFENRFAEAIGEAVIKAMEKAIIAGDGSGKPLGITEDSRVPGDNEITLSDDDVARWDSWKKKVFAKIPLAYRAGGSFLMAAGTFEANIDGMVDANGQPIGRTNYGITSGPQERFGGREVLLVEDDVISPYSSASSGDVFTVFCKLSDYCINSNMQMTMYRWTDHDNNEKVNKALLVADGKILDPNGIMIVKKA
jgi:HK97 family phage major capsid protein